MRHLRIATAAIVGIALLAAVPLAGADAPGVSIDSAPASPTSSTAADFSFSSPDPGAGFDCDLDGGGLAPCSSPVAYAGLADGSHTFTVRATNATLETSSASFTWTIDTVPPPVPTITGGPASSGTDTTPTFTFVSADAAGFNCAVDDDTPETSCDGGSFTAATLADGDHTFYVTATDALGNTSGAASRAFAIDTTPPPVPTITSGPIGLTNDATPTFAFASSGASTLKCAIDDPSPSTLCNSGAFTPATLGNGAHAFYVTAADALGNTSDAALRSFTVDNVPPGTTITPVPETTSSSNIAIAFSSGDPAASFACSVDGAGFAPCSSPLELVGLGDGAHTVAVRATDLAGNTDPTPATVGWVVDTTAPVLTGPGNLVVEADGPTGTNVTYAVSGSDDGLALLPGAISCAPASAAKFPLGQTAVTCSAADAIGNTGTLSFTITVVDTTPPVINAPNASFTATDASGIARTEPPVAAYLAGISATDIVSRPTLTTTTPERLPIGITKIVVTARDAAGNQAERTVTITILEPGKTAPPPDFTPPGPVRSVKATARDHAVLLTWTSPNAPDLASIRIVRSVVGSTASTTVYKGLASTFTNRGLQNGVSYRFILVALDTAGNSSQPVVVSATPTARLLASPKAGAKVTKPPVLRWAPVRSARYFNVQLYRGGRKILSAWPTLARLPLKSQWSHEKRQYRLKPGVYTWYVWPGVGSRSAAVYGPLLGKSSFTVTVPPRV